MDVSCFTSCRFNSSSWNLLPSSSPAQSFTKNATRFDLSTFFVYFKVSFFQINPYFLSHCLLFQVAYICAKQEDDFWKVLYIQLMC